MQPSELWQRLTRRSMAPRQPPLQEHQYALALITAVILIASIIAVIAITTR